MQIPLRRKILYFCVPYIIFATLLGLIELGARAFTEPVSPLEYFTGKRYDQNIKAYYGQQVFEGNTLRAWQVMPNLGNAHWDFTTFSTNDDGIRYPKNLGRKKDGAIRIVALGDSITFGYRVPVAFPADPLNYDAGQKPYTQIIEEVLHRKNPERNIEVIPLAVPGYTTYQGRLWFAEMIDRLDPDLTIVLYGWNDTALNEQEDRDAFPSASFARLEREIISRSQALIYGVTWIRSRGKPGVDGQEIAKVSRVSQNDFVGNILEMAGMAQKKGAQVLILAPVIRDGVTDPAHTQRIASYRDALKDAANANNLPYLEIPELFETAYPQNEMLFGELIHPNAAGHQLIAGRIIDRIEGNYLLPAGK